MTKIEFYDLNQRFGALSPLPIALLDGRMGLCTHFNDTDISVDAYRGNECETVRLPYARVAHVQGGALVETK